MKCTNCGNDFQDGMGYCPYCGVDSLPRTSAVQPVVQPIAEKKERKHMAIVLIVLGAALVALGAAILIISLNGGGSGGGGSTSYPDGGNGGGGQIAITTATEQTAAEQTAAGQITTAGQPAAATDAPFISNVPETDEISGWYVECGEDGEMSDWIYRIGGGTIRLYDVDELLESACVGMFNYETDGHTLKLEAVFGEDFEASDRVEYELGGSEDMLYLYSGDTVAVRLMKQNKQLLGDITGKWYDENGGYIDLDGEALTFENADGSGSILLFGNTLLLFRGDGNWRYVEDVYTEGGALYLDGAVYHKG